MKLEDSIVTTSIQQDIETRVFSPTTYTYGEERPKLPGHGGGSGGRTTRTQKRRQSDSAGSGPGAEGRKRQKKASENGQI